MGFRQEEQKPKTRKNRKQEKKQPTQKLTTYVRSSESVARINETTVRENDHQTLTSSVSIDYSLRVQKLQVARTFERH